MKLKFSRQSFEILFKYEIWSQSVQWEPSCSMRTDGQLETDRRSWQLLFVILRTRRRKLNVPCQQIFSYLTSRKKYFIPKGKTENCAFALHKDICERQIYSSTHLNLCTRWRWVIRFKLQPLSTQEKGHRYSLNRRPGESQTRSRWCWRSEILLPVAGIEIRYIDRLSTQPSHNSDYANQPPYHETKISLHWTSHKFRPKCFSQLGVTYVHGSVKAIQKQDRWKPQKDYEKGWAFKRYRKHISYWSTGMSYSEIIRKELLFAVTI